MSIEKLLIWIIFWINSRLINFWFCIFCSKPPCLSNIADAWCWLPDSVTLIYSTSSSSPCTRWWGVAYTNEDLQEEWRLLVYVKLGAYASSEDQSGERSFVRGDREERWPLDYYSHMLWNVNQSILWDPVDICTAGDNDQSKRPVQPSRALEHHWGRWQRNLWRQSPPHQWCISGLDHNDDDTSLLKSIFNEWIKLIQ